MLPKSLHLSALLLTLAACQSPPPSTSPLPPVHSADLRNGSYQNPILHADYSDPDVIRVGDAFYMTASSFSCFPGLPILRSTDLVNWTLIAHALQKYPAPFADFFNTPQHGNGVWAPALRFHNGQFYIYFGDPDNGVFMTHAKNPAGPWSPLTLLQHGGIQKGWIDTCPFWDDDGRAYLVHAFAKSRAGINNSLDICQMSPDGTTLLDAGTRVFDGGPDQSPTATYTTVEGPKLYKRNGFYYIFAPGGGVANGYQIVFRSTHILGPYDSRIVLAQGNTPINGPHQGAWVTTQTGEDWFIHFQDADAYGRITHLQPLAWINDWPVIGDDPNHTGKGSPVLTHKKPDTGTSPSPPAAPQTSDEFTGPALGLQWQWPANFNPAWATFPAPPATPPHLQLASVSLDHDAPLFNRPNLLLQKFPAESFTATTLLDPSPLAPGESAGLVIVGPTTASLTVRPDATGILVTRTNFTAPKANAPLPLDIPAESLHLSTAPVYLRVTVSPTARCLLSLSTDGQTFTLLGPPFTATKDQWIGAKLGLFANAPKNTPTTGHATFRWFHFEKP